MAVPLKINRIMRHACCHIPHVIITALQNLLSEYNDLNPHQSMSDAQRSVALSRLYTKYSIKKRFELLYPVLFFSMRQPGKSCCNTMLQISAVQATNLFNRQEMPENVNDIVQDEDLGFRQSVIMQRRTKYAIYRDMHLSGQTTKSRGI